MPESVSNLTCPKCGSLMNRVWTPPAVICGEWDTVRRGYRSRIVQPDIPDDPEGELRYDLRKLEESMHEEGNLKEYYKKKRALKEFEIGNKDILRK